MIALGWANIGAAVAPDAALAAVASAIILVQGGQGRAGVDTAIAVAIPLAVAGLFLTMIVRTLAVPIVHMMDTAAEDGNIRKIYGTTGNDHFICEGTLYGRNFAAGDCTAGFSESGLFHAIF